MALHRRVDTTYACGAGAGNLKDHPITHSNKATVAAPAFSQLEPFYEALEEISDTGYVQL